MQKRAVNWYVNLENKKYNEKSVGKRCCFRRVPAGSAEGRAVEVVLSCVRMTDFWASNHAPQEEY